MIQPPHGGTKIASCCSGINVGSDFSRCVHIKAHQWVSTTVGTTLPPAPSANAADRPSARCRRGVAVSNRRLPPAKAMCLHASTVQAPYKMGAIKTQPFKMSPHCGTGHSMPRWGPAVPTLPRNPRRTSHEKDCVRDRHGYGLGLGSVGPGGAKWSPAASSLKGAERQASALLIQHRHHRHCRRVCHWRGGHRHCHRVCGRGHG